MRLFQNAYAPCQLFGFQDPSTPFNPTENLPSLNFHGKPPLTNWTLGCGLMGHISNVSSSPLLSIW